MNKSTIISLILIANLHGQMASADEVRVSSARLNEISRSELTTLTHSGALRFQNGSAILNLRQLDQILKNQENAIYLATEAEKLSARSVPYGHTEEPVSYKAEDLAEKLAARYIPYGNTISP